MRRLILLKKVTLFLLSTVLFFPNNAFTQCVGGAISDSNGQNIIYTCTGDGNPDVINFSTTGSSTQTDYAYVITDTQNEIIGFVAGNSHDFEEAGIGNCFVWGFAYTGDITATIGASVFSTKFSTGCWQISSTRIDINRNEAPLGGTIASSNGATTVNVCLDDGIPDFVGFNTTGSTFAQYDYLITDENNNILSVVQNGFHNFENAGAGTCRVWGVAYTGILNAPIGNEITSITLSDDCFSLSANYVSINRSSVDGGSISIASGENQISVCTDDELPDVIDLQNTSTASGKYIYVITNVDNQLLQLADAGSIDFEGTPEGICRVWGFSYSGNILLENGDVIWDKAFSDGCYKISSNAITIIRTSCDIDECELEAASISSSNGLIELCEAQDETKEVDINITGGNTTNGMWIITTDPDETIVAFDNALPIDLSGFAHGSYRVSYLGFEEAISGVVMGNTVADIKGCFAKSNSLEVRIEDMDICAKSCEGIVDGATIFSGEEFTEFNLCFENEGDEELLPFFNTSSSDADYAYVITNSDNKIMSFGVNGGQLKFNTTPEGFESVRVWGVSYTGLLQAFLSADVTTAQLSSDCFSLSANYITVNKGLVQAGMLKIGENQTQLEVPANQKIVLDINQSGAASRGAKYRYLLIRLPKEGTSGVPGQIVSIIQSQGNNQVRLDPLNADFNYRIYGLAYSGRLLVSAGFDGPISAILELPFSSGCYDLSDNFIELLVIPEGRPPFDGFVNNTPDNDQTSPITSFSITPNPARHFTKVYLESKTDYSNGRLLIHDLSGRQIHKERVTLSAGLNELDVGLNNFPIGLYLVSIITPDCSIHGKVIKK